MSSFSFLTAGESHGPQLTIIVRGMPAGVRLDGECINLDLRRRQHGYGRGRPHERSRPMSRGHVRRPRWRDPRLPDRDDDPQRRFRELARAMNPWEVDEAEVHQRRVHAPSPILPAG
jgi:chorismate synthase